MGAELQIAVPRSYSQWSITWPLNRIPPDEGWPWNFSPAAPHPTLPHCLSVADWTSRWSLGTGLDLEGLGQLRHDTAWTGPNTSTIKKQPLPPSLITHPLTYNSSKLISSPFASIQTIQHGASARTSIYYSFM